MDVKLVRMEWPVLFLMEEWPEKPPRRPLDHSYFVGKRAVFTARACAEGERADLSYQLRD